MTLEEIHEELYGDLKNIKAKVGYLSRDFARRVLKASGFPFTFSYDCYSPIKKNLFIVTLTAMNRGHWNRPFIGIYGIYNRPEGNYVADLNLDIGTTCIYPPHFFSRYRERIAKDTTSSNNEIIRRFFGKYLGFMATALNEKQQAVYCNFEDENDPVGFVSVTSEGFCFGQRQGDIMVVKTLISKEMLFEDQKAVFDMLRKEFQLLGNKRYKTDITF